MADRKKSRKLVVEQLEKVSGEILEEYQDAIRDLIRRRSGIYALYRRGSLYYVGLAKNLMGRLRTHKRDRHNGYWDRFSVYLTRRDEHMRELEALLLRIVEPAGNKVRGKFAGAKNLLGTLNRRAAQIDKERRDGLLGRRRRRVRARGGKALDGALSRPKRLRGEDGRWEYRAVLGPNGLIRYGRETYDSPNAAARAAVGRRCNGWTFWKYRDRRGEWVPLKNLK